MPLIDTPEIEARAALAIASFCPDAEPWQEQPKGGVGFECGAGLVDAAGNYRGLTVALLVSQARTTKLKRFKFSVFKSTQWGAERLYQLDVQNWRVVPRMEHSQPHEHFGRYRSAPQIAWISWTFDQALTHFSQATNITFTPRVTDPFELDFNLR
jgi:hypothetical protein